MYGSGLDLSGSTSPANKLNVDGNIYFGNSVGNPVAGLPTSVNDTINYIGGNGSGRFENRRWLSAFVVDPSASEGERGTYQTISAASAAASSGDTILIRPGTYTEDWTMKGGVSYIGVGTELTAQIVLSGTITLDGASTAFMKDLRLTSNGSNILNVTGSGTNQTRFQNCRFVYSDDDMMICDNANASIGFDTCVFSQGANGLKLFDITTCDEINFYGADEFNVGFTPGASTIAAGSVSFIYCRIGGNTFETTGTGKYFFRDVFYRHAENKTFLTTVGTARSQVENCCISSGTSAAISVGSGTSVEIWDSTIESTNANPITGSGDVIYNNVGFIGTGNGIDTTTKTPRYNQIGKFRSIGQPSFLAIRSGSASNVTGNGTEYTVNLNSEIYDQDSNFSGTTFTAPVSGRYIFSYAIYIGGLGAGHTSCLMRLVTSNRNYLFNRNNTANSADSGSYCQSGSVVADMDAGDTANIVVVVSGSTQTISVVGDGNNGSYFSGELIA